MADQADIVEGGGVGAERRAHAHEAGVPGTDREAQPTQPVELHVCMGLNACKGHDVGGKAQAQAFARKRGFAVPVIEWVARRGAKLGPLVAAQPGIREICLPDAVEKLFANAEGKRPGFAAWTLLFYALWHRHHILRLPLAPDVFTALAIIH